MRQEIEGMTADVLKYVIPRRKIAMEEVALVESQIAAGGSNPTESITSGMAGLQIGNNPIVGVGSSDDNVNSNAKETSKLNINFDKMTKYIVTLVKNLLKEEEALRKHLQTTEFLIKEMAGTVETELNAKDDQIKEIHENLEDEINKTQGMDQASAQMTSKELILNKQLWLKFAIALPENRYSEEHQKINNNANQEILSIFFF